MASFSGRLAPIISISLFVMSCLTWSEGRSQSGTSRSAKTDSIPSKKIEKEKVTHDESVFDDDGVYFPESFLDIDWDEIGEQIESPVNEALDDCDINIDESMDDFEQFDDSELENNMEEGLDFVQQAQKDFDINNRIDIGPRNLGIEIQPGAKEVKKELDQGSKAVELSKKQIKRALEKVQKEINQAGLTSI